MLALGAMVLMMDIGITHCKFSSKASVGTKFIHWYQHLSTAFQVRDDSGSGGLMSPARADERSRQNKPSAIAGPDVPFSEVLNILLLLRCTGSDVSERDEQALRHRSLECP